MRLIALFTVVACCLILLTATAWCQTSENQSPILLVIDQSQTGASYRIDGINITEDPLRGIARAFERHGSKIDYPISVILDDELPIKMLTEASGLVGKVGFTHIRYFRASKRHGKMGELVLGKVSPLPALAK